MKPFAFRIAPARRRPRCGATLIETLITMFILSLVTTAILGLTATATRTADRRTLENRMGAYARTSLDEILRELRAAQGIAVGQSVGGTNHTTSSSDIVFWAPRYDASGTLANPPDLDADLVVFRFNPNTDPNLSTITETTVVGAGSIRPSRTGYVIARQLYAGGVKGVQYTYEVREHFVIEAGQSQSTFALKTQAATTPLVYVGDSATPVATTSTAPASTITTAGPIENTGTGPRSVQILYTVDPATNPAGLRHVNGVGVTLALSERDGRAIPRTIMLSGKARLRNKRT